MFSAYHIFVRDILYGNYDEKKAVSIFGSASEHLCHQQGQEISCFSLKYEIPHNKRTYYSKEFYCALWKEKKARKDSDT